MTDGFLFCICPSDSDSHRPRGAVRRMPDWGLTWTARHWRASVRVSPSARKKGSYLNDRWLPFFAFGPPAHTHTAPEGISVTSREIHLGRSMPSGAPVSYAACLDEAIYAASSQGKANTASCGEASLPR